MEKEKKRIESVFCKILSLQELAHISNRKKQLEFAYNEFIQKHQGYIDGKIPVDELANALNSLRASMDMLYFSTTSPKMIP